MVCWDRELKQSRHRGRVGVHVSLCWRESKDLRARIVTGTDTVEISGKEEVFSELKSLKPSSCESQTGLQRPGLGDTRR